MKIQQKENSYIKINLNLDRQNYFKFIKDIKELAKGYEHKSNIKNLKYSLVFNGVKTPYMETGGWANRCEDFKFVIFLDFDNSLWWQVKTQLEFLMERFDLSPFYVFQTESKEDCNNEEYGSYNCVCLTKKRFFEVFEIQNETTCDQAHKNLPKIYRFHSHILRNVSKGAKGKPVFKCVVGDIQKAYKQPISSAHLDFLHKMYDNVPKIKYLAPDGFKTLWLSNYKTASP
ncbi:MAG: hypothetical protein KKB31_04415 [Nanoarchaeota archaeon]|nr:hypothetical protein [Nanoarchaeota archaeon]